MQDANITINQAKFQNDMINTFNKWMSWPVPILIGEFKAEGATLTWLLDQYNSRGWSWAPWR